MRDYLEIGPTPPEEDCVGVGDPDYYEKARPECKRYIEAIRAKLGEEPGSAHLTIRSNPHDFGDYLEVAVVFDDNDEEALDYALAVEACGPATWDDTQRVDWREALAAHRAKRESRGW